MKKAKDIMTKNPIAVDQNMPVYDALTLILNHNITGLPVINDDEQVIGVLSEKDLLSLLNNKKASGQTVEKFMTINVVTFDEETDIHQICDCFEKNYFRRVPILKEGKLTGIITRRDIVSFILESRQLQHENLS